ncbi:MarR family winged helix-turn-helix transcriptional regulator [Sphaerisporangium perillae]|uniref:MarR family winged helix-turn-helix transcriptional regulator n=1 Tax=Sphaerisporangium perillae TaxID=2935860 RepID=UPI002010BC3F|nr:MarR family transcriptional regulator [Sphaerisporangium perillae]
MARSWNAFLAGYELTQGQYGVLVTLKEQGLLGQRHLADLVAVDARNIVAVLDSLEAKGLVERQAHGADGRRRIVALTDKGSALIETVGAMAAAHEDDFLHALTDRERERLNALLQRIYDSHLPGV